MVIKLKFSFDGEYFHSVESSKFSHQYVLGLGNYKNQALTTGCYGSSECYVKTELFNMETLTWSDGPDFPFATRFLIYRLNSRIFRILDPRPGE